MGVPVTQCTLAWKQSVTTYLTVISVCPWCFILKLLSGKSGRKTLFGDLEHPVYHNAYAHTAAFAVKKNYTL